MKGFGRHEFLVYLRFSLKFQEINWMKRMSSSKTSLNRSICLWNSWYATSNLEDMYIKIYFENWLFLLWGWKKVGHLQKWPQRVFMTLSLNFLWKWEVFPPREGLVCDVGINSGLLTITSPHTPRRNRNLIFSKQAICDNLWQTIEGTGASPGAALESKLWNWGVRCSHRRAQNRKHHWQGHSIRPV